MKEGKCCDSRCRATYERPACWNARDAILTAPCGFFRVNRCGCLCLRHRTSHCVMPRREHWLIFVPAGPTLHAWCLTFRLGVRPAVAVHKKVDLRMLSSNLVTTLDDEKLAYVSPLEGSFATERRQTMKYRKLGNTGLIVSEVALGSMQFGAKMNMGNLGRDDTSEWWNRRSPSPSRIMSVRDPAPSCCREL